MKSAGFPATIFLSAFLLFQIQPILGRFVLPWFGGTPAVWTTCLLFFQSALLIGYLYAHWLGSRTRLRAQSTIHSVLLAASLALLPIIPGAFWKPVDAQDPSGRILLMLLATVGGPYILLASTAPLLQRWFHLSRPGLPWRLYALSNLASFCALLTYPVLVEPFLRLRTQAILWSALYVIFAASCIGLALSLRAREIPTEPEEHPADDDSPPPLTVVYWVALAATGSALLMATTNEISQEIAVSPFLWIAPLSIYLLSFVLTFDSSRWYRRPLFAVLAGVLAPAACVVTTLAVGLSLWTQLAVYLTALLAACMVCHGELVRAKPSPTHLTGFYLSVAAGGALGGIFAAIVAPRSFTEFSEFPIAFSAACLLGLVGWWKSEGTALWTTGKMATRLSTMALLLGGVSALVTMSGTPTALATVRNFYGMLRVVEGNRGGPVRLLTHGRILHGFQFQDATRRLWPTSYFGPHTGAGIVLQAASASPRRMAVVGLGTGTMAAWGRTGDSIRYYEINPAVEKIARQWFTYLADSKARVDVVLGDARVQMERERASGRSHDFDVIAVDAFSSDSIPIHLLTAEFADVLRDRLAPGGILLFHISNRTLNLEPVVRGLADHLGWPAALFINGDLPESGEDGARWVAVASDPAFLTQPALASQAMGWSMPVKPPLLWSDDFASLWHVFKLN